MRKLGWLSAILLATTAMGCGGDPIPNPFPVDVQIVDDVQTPSDGPVGTDRPADVRDTGVRDTGTPVDAGTSTAGVECTMPADATGKGGDMDPACGPDMLCINTGVRPQCTNQCDNDPSQTVERAACGGTGSTCLTQGDDISAQSRCAAACRVTAMTAATGACAAGNVCTGWWYTHAMGTPDSTGCYAFCDADAQCPTGTRCDTRMGTCSATGTDMTRLPDSAPCNPSTTVIPPGEMTARNIQCRGICWRIDSHGGTGHFDHGICGSLLNTRTTAMCPDDPDNVNVLGRAGADNLGICIWRTCTRNSDCRSPHICRYVEDAAGVPDSTRDRQCDFPTTAQPTGTP